MKRRRRATTANTARHTLKSIYDEMTLLRRDLVAGDRESLDKIASLGRQLYGNMQAVERALGRQLYGNAAPPRAPFDLTMEAFA